MGQVEGTPTCQELRLNDDGDFVMVSNSLPEVFQFDPSESYVIAYGIDKQASPKFDHKSLGPVTVDDAEQVLNALVEIGAVSPGNAHLYAASRNKGSCTAQGMKKTFQEVASKVSPNGLFVFHFSGHGIKVRNEEWGLAPVDFDYSHDTYVTANVLSSWLNEIDCKAKYILVTLDCCYAGGIGEELANQMNTERNMDLYVISACNAYETSLVLGSLGHSVFTYFLSHFIMKYKERPGTLLMKKIFSECRICCECLTSTLVSYNEEAGLQMKLMQPQMSVRNIKTFSEDSTDAAVERFDFAVQLYDRSSPMIPLDEKTIAYLDSITNVPDGPLIQLEKRGLLRDRVIDTVLCSIMYSIASHELACDTKQHTKVKNSNLSITAFMHAAAAIDMIHHNVTFMENIFYLSWLYYKEVIYSNNIKSTKMDNLHSRLALDIKKFNVPLVRETSSTTWRGEDMTDSDEVGSLVEHFHSIKKWIPLCELTELPVK